MNYHIRMMTLLLVALIIPPATTALGQNATLRLEDVYREVRERNPRVQAAAAFVQARRALEPSAGLPRDPEIVIGAMNFSVPRFSADMPTSMVPSIQIMQMLPLFGKLQLSERIARQSTNIARAEAAEAWWEVRAQAAAAFYEVVEADQQIAVMHETLRLLQNFRRVAQAMYSAGEGRQTDVLRAGVEVARMEADIKRMQALRVAAAARLNAVRNLAPGTVVPAPTLPMLPAALPPNETLREWAEDTRPLLTRGQTDIERASSNVELARKEIWPDVTVGVQYGQNKMDRMGSVMLGFSIPLFAGSRQLKMRDEAEAMREMTRADLTRMHAEVSARIDELVANLDRNRTLIELYRTDVLPQANANVQSAFSSYRVGQVDFMTLVDAQMTANRYKQELATLVTEYGADIAELEMTVGRELPINSALAIEGK